MTRDKLFWTHRSHAEHMLFSEWINPLNVSETEVFPLTSTLLIIRLKQQQVTAGFTCVVLFCQQSSSDGRELIEQILTTAGTNCLVINVLVKKWQKTLLKAVFKARLCTF